MKSFTALCLFALVAVSLASPERAYTDRYDHMDPNTVLNNARLRQSYVKCLLGTGRCTPEGEALLANVRDALENGCKKCTEAQRKNIPIVISFFLKNDVENWNKLKKKYDPQDKYASKYENELREIRG